MAEPRVVGGVSCTEVLAHLPDYLDGSLPGPARAQVDAHLRGCDWCEHFGGAYALTVRRLREELSAPEPLPGELRARLGRKLGLD